MGNSNGIQESKQTRITVEPEPHAYTISFFKLPNRATNEILKSHRKRDSDGIEKTFACFFYELHMSILCDLDIL